MPRGRLAAFPAMPIGSGPHGGGGGSLAAAAIAATSASDCNAERVRKDLEGSSMEAPCMRSGASMVNGLCTCRDCHCFQCQQP